MVMIACADRQSVAGESFGMVFRGIGRAIGQLVRDARRRHEARRAVTLLLSMDAHVLRDIGVTRSDVIRTLNDHG